MSVSGESHPYAPSEGGTAPRNLIYFPVIHTSVDLGALATRVQTTTSATFGTDA